MDLGFLLFLFFYGFHNPTPDSLTERVLCQRETIPASFWVKKRPETNISPENTPLEKEIPIGHHNFLGLCSFSEGI